MNKRWIIGGLLTILLLGITVLVQSQSITANDSFKQDFLSRINKVRAVGCSCGKKYYPPAAPLTWNNNLEIAAQGHAQDMNFHNYFNHTSKDGRNSEDRIVAAGYYFNGYRSFAVGENIAYGQQSIAEVSDGWFKSVGHCQNLMNPQFKEIGIARNGLYWVQDFGGRESFTPEEQKLIKQGNVRMIIKKERSE
ncbi:CAP domain-containing protein [Mucilaginibacter jinjuensis]|uniref:CAP domain-containing protein n=1 Tax=Mucilaginibacter jinjuensis TaxID=1176721 RepID=A0ABY7T0S7_9SPHI|nr:CAP domain-containing protein [Mucilaginibacter jinjuensis]WCT10040.1 CAP domain-containing protein [Mucilaginibacter jinjuensis]